MTGDLVHHQVWNTTVEDNILHYVGFMNSLSLAFPNTKIYPAIGNHEPHPCNMFPPQEVWADYDLGWMYNFQAVLYENHLEPQALATFRRAGYYTQLHAPGFRIVTLNTNFCYTNNFWIMYQAIDPEVSCYMSENFILFYKLLYILYIIRIIFNGFPTQCTPQKWPEKRSGSLVMFLQVARIAGVNGVHNSSELSTDIRTLLWRSVR